MSAPRIHDCGTEAGYQRHRYYSEDPCTPCRDARRQAERARYHRNNPGAQRRFQLRHGTNASYVGGCRCDSCREAHAEYQWEWTNNGGRARERVTIKTCALDVLETIWPDRLTTAQLVNRIMDIHPEWSETNVRRMIQRDVAPLVEYDTSGFEAMFRATAPSWEAAS